LKLAVLYLTRTRLKNYQVAALTNLKISTVNSLSSSLIRGVIPKRVTKEVKKGRKSKLNEVHLGFIKNCSKKEHILISVLEK
jgi:hypothetical protein